MRFNSCFSKNIITLKKKNLQETALDVITRMNFKCSESITIKSLQWPGQESGCTQKSFDVFRLQSSTIPKTQHYMKKTAPGSSTHRWLGPTQCQDAEKNALCFDLLYLMSSHRNWSLPPRSISCTQNKPIVTGRAPPRTHTGPSQPYTAREGRC